MKTAPEAFSSVIVIACPVCGERTRLYGVEPHIRLAHTEVHTYVCDACNVIEALVVPMPNQRNESSLTAAQR